MHPYKNYKEMHVAHRRAKAISRAEGGVASMPLSLERTAEVINRMKDKPNFNMDQARDFAASRVRAHGLDPMLHVGAPAKYKKGGRS